MQGPLVVEQRGERGKLHAEASELRGAQTLVLLEGHPLLRDLCVVAALVRVVLDAFLVELRGHEAQLHSERAELRVASVLLLFVACALLVQLRRQNGVVALLLVQLVLQLFLLDLVHRPLLAQQRVVQREPVLERAELGLDGVLLLVEIGALVVESHVEAGIVSLVLVLLLSQHVHVALQELLHARLLLHIRAALHVQLGCDPLQFVVEVVLIVFVLLALLPESGGQGVLLLLSGGALRLQHSLQSRQDRSMKGRHVRQLLRRFET
mmetsp:Transcript_7137/g.12368  ORF Transcript_7137/g.12368 Transcript_7137/m.12368 type:complete len:266 (+) Transcript_7137:1006-1803(+)